MPAANAWHLKQAVRALRAGGVVAYPTEAVYGLGCDPMNERAIMRLLSIKGRALDKGLILVAADSDQLQPLLQPQPEALMAPVEKSWPGPCTWLLPAAAGVPVWLTGGGECVAVRVTAHPLAAALARAFGAPLVSTSANPSGVAPPRSALGARRMVGARVDYFLSGATGGARRASEIRDVRDGRVLRAG